MITNNFDLNGLTNEQVVLARNKYGENKVIYKSESILLNASKNLAKEPMIILLLVASIIYFLSGKTGDGIFLAFAIVLVATISFYQNARSKNALKKYTQPNCKVIRNSRVIEIKSEELVMGDNMIVEEGTSISADGVILYSNDFSVNESILTGESLVVYKDKTQVDRFIYQGTTVSGGMAIASITAIGNQTKLGRIGNSLENIKEEKSPLELQIYSFVKKMVVVGSLIFVLVWIINYFKSYNLLDSLLKGLTLAMSILPEEIPVAFTTFMALGAWRLMKEGIVVKQMKTVETLGSATIICTDKTGTLTENRMSLAKLFVLSTNRISDLNQKLGTEEIELITLAMWSSEPIPFDPMEIALHDVYQNTVNKDERSQYKMIHEYALGGNPPMMTHIFENREKHRIIAAKGAPEALINVSEITELERQNLNNAINTLASEGYRVLGVGTTNFTEEHFPKFQQHFKFNFKGIVAFYDPPKPNIHTVLEHFYNAGIAVKIVTGDNTATTTAIAKQIKFKGYEKSITGDELMKLSENELKRCVLDIQIFTRMFPEAKLKIINALKSNNEIVAMTGDGVNDAPALKAAHIGIAMGNKGTEIAKQAASLILVNDDLSKIINAIEMGRKIYANLKKAIQYIISIHIPILLTVIIPLSFGWIYPNIFSPIHIIFLELIMGPTCSIIYENEPIEKNVMLQMPRSYMSTFFSWNELATSIIQGLVITLATLSVYQFGVLAGLNQPLIRTMVFVVLITANVFLTLVNRSFYYSIITTLKYKNNLVFIVIASTLTIVGFLLYVKPFTIFFQFQSLSLFQLFISFAAGFISVIWFEALKWFKRAKRK